MREALVKKTAIVKEINDKIINSQSLVVLEYKKLKVSELEQLRKQLRKNDAELKIYKNNLASLALANTEFKKLSDYLVGPNALVFGNGDQISAAKVAAKFSKFHPDLKLKAGIYNSDVLGQEEIMQIALLPTKEEMIASFASLLQQPLIKFAMIIKEIIKTKSV